MDVKTIRVVNGVTARELAELLGINIRTWWRVEEGLRTLRQCEEDTIRQYLEKLAEKRRKWNEIRYSNRGGA